MTVYVEKTMQGYRIYYRSGVYGEKTHYVGYTLKQAIKKYRETHNLKGKHLNIIEI